MGVVPLRAVGQESSDEELMLQLAAGQEEALGPLYSRYAARIFHLAARNLDRPTAEEIVQEVFLTVWRQASRFDPEQGAFRPWVFQIAHFRIANELRRRSRRPQIEPDPEGFHLGNLADETPQPDEAIWRAQRRTAVRAAVDDLPPPQRQAVRLAFFEGLTHEQVAALLNLPLGTAKTRIRAGLQKLRTSLTPQVVVLLLAALLALLGLRYRSLIGARQRDDRALALATPRGDIVARVLHGHGHIGDGDQAPGTPAYDPTLHQSYHYDPRAARALLRRDGYRPLKDGLLGVGAMPLTVTLWADASCADCAATLALVARGWRAAGIASAVKRTRTEANSRIFTRVSC